MVPPVIADQYTATRVYFGSVIGLLVAESLLPFAAFAYQSYNTHQRKDRHALHWSFTVQLHKLLGFPLPIPFFTDHHIADVARFTAFVALNVIFATQENQFTTDYKLYGWLTIANGGLALLMASRNNLFATVLRIPSPVILQYHRWTGVATLAHATAHVAFNIQHYIQTQQLATSFANTRIRIGLMAWIALAIMFLTALPIVRRRFFEVFYFTHGLFIVFTIGALIHAAHGPEFLLPGLLLWAVDRAIRFAYNFRRIEIQHITSYEGGVTKFKVKGLRNASPGQIVWLQLPKISFVNWHPFTVASAPNDPEQVAVIAVRGLGGFTKAVQYAGSNGADGHSMHPTSDSSRMMDTRPKMRLDGPYGVGRIPWGKLPLTVLVAGGIGITPGISIASHIIRQAASCAGSQSPHEAMAHVHLMWVVKDSRHIEWFQDELTQLYEVSAKEDLPVTLDISIYVTGGGRSAPPHADEEGSLRMQDLEPSERPWAVHQGRPNIKAWFNQVKIDRVGMDGAVNLCGPRMLINQARNAAMSVSDEQGLFYVQEEVFEF
ncbi:hypothetical protein AUP68_05547 [Ilyonectria robusta]